MSTDHPIHPATVHWPIAFLSLSYGLDTLYGLTTYLPSLPLVTALHPHLPDLAKASHYLQLLGVVTGILSAASGGQQLVKMISAGGVYESDGKTMRKKVKMTLAHAAANDVILLASAWGWWSRRGEAGLEPSGLNVVVASLLLPVLMWSANLGGTLTYNLGVGLNLGTKGKKQ